MLSKLYHWFEHLFGVNEGRIATWEDGGDICIGFECIKCGKIDPHLVDRIKGDLIYGKPNPDSSFE